MTVFCGDYQRQLSEFWEATYREIYNVLKGARRREELEQQAAWERMRIHATLLLQAKVKKGVRLKPTDLINLPWDKKEKPKAKEVSEETRKKWERWDAEMKAGFAQVKE
jgi:hypothetical protein